MLYVMIPQKFLTISYSNSLIAEISGIEKKSIPQLFIIKMVDDFEKVLKLYHKSISFHKGNKDLKLILAPTFSDWYLMNYMKRNGYGIIPSSIFLLLKRPRPASPFDLQLFRNDLIFWFKRLYSWGPAKSFEFIFIYDAIHLPSVLIKYIPLLLMYKENNADKVFSTCCYETICDSYIGDFGEFFLLLNLWVSNIYNVNINSSALYDRIDIRIDRVNNPLFNSGIYMYKNIECIHQNIYLDSILQGNRATKLIVEFTSSYTLTLLKDANLNNIIYFWFPLPLSSFVLMFNELTKYLHIHELLVIDIINNIAEFGSLSPDRIWLNVLKHVSKARKIKTIIGY